jgi:TatD DNase family protein
MAIHGFNGTAQLAMQLVEKGFHLSVGSLLLDSKSKVSQAISTIPISRLFFETDSSSVDIKLLYQVASDKLNITTEDLKIQIAKNFTEFFNTSALP